MDAAEEVGSFVSDLVNRMTTRGFQVWIDQQLLIGGNDWMDSVGDALATCNAFLLVMNPEALQSRYVKMEYRYCFNHGKPIVPVMIRPVDPPFEIAGLHYLDFTNTSSRAYPNLFQTLAQQLN